MFLPRKVRLLSRQGYFSPPVVIILALITFGVAVVIFFNRDLILKTKENQPTAPPVAQQSPQVSPKPSPTPDETANWKTYTDNSAKISFKYPSNWEITSSDPFHHFSNTKDCNPGSYENMGNCSSLDYGIGGGDPRPTTPGLKEKQFDGITFYELPGYADEGTIQTKEFFVHRGAWYSIAFNRKNDGTSEQLFYQILSTFQFLN